MFRRAQPRLKLPLCVFPNCPHWDEGPKRCRFIGLQLPDPILMSRFGAGKVCVLCSLPTCLHIMLQAKATCKGGGGGSLRALRWALCPLMKIAASHLADSHCLSVVACLLQSSAAPVTAMVALCVAAAPCAVRGRVALPARASRTQRLCVRAAAGQNNLQVCLEALGGPARPRRVDLNSGSHPGGPSFSRLLRKPCSVFGSP